MQISIAVFFIILQMRYFFKNQNMFTVRMKKE